MNCFGLDVTTEEELRVSFDRTILSVEHLVAKIGDLPYIAPGWVDLQVNGFAGVDYNAPQASHEEIARSVRTLFSTGVTRFYPTVITGSPADMTRVFRNLAEAKESLPEGNAIEGFHLEGPHISPEDGPRGAHPRQWIRPPSLDEFHRFQEAARGHIRLVTLAPEWPQATRYIEAVVSEGVVVSLGHTNAGASEIADAVKAGATMSTHLGNGADHMLPRRSNCIWEQLANDRLAAGFIVDGVHLSDSFLKVALRAKGVERSILVTDAAMPAGCEAGMYTLGSQQVELTADNRVMLAGEDRLAGSALRMDRGIENLMRIVGLTLLEAVTMASRNPARVGRLSSRQRGLNPGERADFVLFQFDSARKRIDILETYVDGECVYTAMP